MACAWTGTLVSNAVWQQASPLPVIHEEPDAHRVALQGHARGQCLAAGGAVALILHPPTALRERGQPLLGRIERLAGRLRRIRHAEYPIAERRQRRIKPEPGCELRVCRRALDALAARGDDGEIIARGCELRAAHTEWSTECDF